MPSPFRSHRALPCLQRGQVMVEYLIVAGLLAAALFATFPGADRSVIALLIQAFQDAWATYSYTLSFPL